MNLSIYAHGSYLLFIYQYNQLNGYYYTYIPDMDCPNIDYN